MLRIIRKLLGRSGSTNAVEAFMRELGDADVFVISATLSEGIDAKSLTPDLLLAEMREALERDRENQKSGYQLFTYTTEAGQRRLPFFLSNEHAQKFCGEYSKQRKRVFPFMVLGMKGTFLGRVTAKWCDVVAMNDKSPNERVLSEEELAVAHRLWGGS